MYLNEKKEENLLKKVLLDMCYREVNKRETEHLYELPKEHPLIVKITEMLKGQRYPTDGPLMNMGERQKHDKYYQEY